MLKSVREHPAVKRVLAAIAGAFALIGVAGVPNDVANWADAIGFVGNEAGRWLLLLVGLAVIALLYVPARRQDLSASEARAIDEGTNARPPEDADEDDETHAPESRDVPLFTALEHAYTEGDRMLKASTNWMIATSFLHGPVPSDADIDAWRKHVGELLPARYKRQFMLAPLESEAPVHPALLKNPLERDETKRLRKSLAELGRIIEALT